MTERSAQVKGMLVSLPDEMVRQVLFLLHGSDVARLSCTCRRLRHMIDDASLWETLVKRDVAVASVSTTVDGDAGVKFACPAQMERLLDGTDRHTPLPLPELPTDRSLRGAGRGWRWFYAACHRRARDPPGDGRRCRSLWWTRWCPWRANRRPRHSIHWLDDSVDGSLMPVDPKLDTLIVEVGDMDEQGRLAGLGMRAMCTRSGSISRSVNNNSNGGIDDNDNVAPTEWRWTEWVLGTWCGGRLGGLGFIRLASGVRHEGRFVGGLPHGPGVSTVPVRCAHKGRHAIEVRGRWENGHVHGRTVQTTSCGDVCVAMWNRGTIESIESLDLPGRTAVDGRPAFAGARIAGVPWRVEDIRGVPGSLQRDPLFDRCCVAMPADLHALDLYLDYIRMGHPCIAVGSVQTIVSVGERFRALLAAALATS